MNGPAFICQGDKTSHGGTVTGGAPISTIMGRAIARKGDLATCPKCGGIYPIVEGNDGMIVDGSPAAYHGAKTACGAILIAGQFVASHELTNGPGQGATSSPTAAHPDSIGSGLLGTFEAAADTLFRGRFRLVDETTGEPVAGRKVKVNTSAGPIEGMTDSDGYTEWVEHEQAETLGFELVDEETQG